VATRKAAASRRANTMRPCLDAMLDTLFFTLAMCMDEMNVLANQERIYRRETVAGLF
jgi:hypothetical protein